MGRVIAWLVLLASIAAAAWLLLTRVLGPETAGSAPGVPASSHAAPPAPRGSGPRAFQPAPVAAAGEAVTIELMEAPAERYADAEAGEGDDAYAALVAELGRRDVVYDPALGRAARELAYQQSLLGGLVPQDIVEFLLRSAGAVDRTIEQGYVSTSGDGAAAGKAQLEKMLGASGGAETVRAGVGEVWIPGAKLPRIVGVLLSRRQVEISPAPRRVDAGGSWTLSGVLPRGYDAPTALALWPDGRFEEITVNTAGRRFSVAVAAGEATGTLHVGVGATGPEGSATLVQLPVEIGRALPETYATRLPPDERNIKTPEAAESLAFDLLNGDRARFGLPPLLRDARLDVVARAHSADMRDHDFFAHVSPRTGGPGDRLAAAGYHALAHAENLARESSLHAAEAGLLASLGHRRNLLSRDVTHVGIGVAGREEQGRIDWHVTQLFARPVVALDLRAEAARVRAALAERRRAARVQDLAPDPGLDRVAGDHARTAAGGELQGLTERVLADTARSGLTPGNAYVWIQRAGDLTGLDLPTQAGDAAYSRVGIGVAQAPHDRGGAAGVVLILAGDPR